MTAQNATCPPDAALADFGLGKLDAASAESVSQHLETCADCQQRVASVSGDSFVGRLREARPKAAVRARTFVPGESLAGRGRDSGVGGHGFVSGESLANAANSTDGSMPKEDGLPRPSRPSRETISRDGLGSPSSISRDGLGSPSSLGAPPELASHPDFKLVKELGQGGMGTVYLAKNRMMDRLEVLKVISTALLDRPGALERFQQEIRSAAKLNHPNIVAAHSVSRPGNLLVFAMEYVRGQDLAQVVKARGPLPVANAAFYAHQVALGLQHAHEKGMVHRDIKPNNLMLTIEGKKHVVKILDFGLSKATSEKGAESGLTKSGQMLGTPDYIAPEQTLDAHQADIRADIYSLGCTLYALLSGGPPFQESSLYGILEAHQKREARPLNLARPDVPVELAAVVAKMMAKQPAKRYQTPQEVARALVPFFKPGQSVPARSATDAGPSPPTTETAAGIASATPPPPIASPIALPLPMVPSAVMPVAANLAASVDHFGLSIDTGRSAPARRREGWSSLPPWQRWSAAGGIAAIVLLAAVLLVRTPHGTVEITLSDPSADVTVAVDGNHIDIAGLDEPLSLDVGKHAITVKGAGYETATKQFKVTSGKNAPLTIRLIARLPKQAPPDDDATAGVPAGAQHFDGHWYKFYREQLSWKAACDRCQLYGGRLVTIDSLPENAFVGGLVANASCQDAWIGATDEKEEGRWRTVDGDLVHFTNWSPQQPNNKNNEEHYALISNRLVGGVEISWRWCDQPNESQKPHQPGFVCEWDAMSSPPTTSAEANATVDVQRPTPPTRFSFETLGGTSGDWAIDDNELVIRGGDPQGSILFGDPSWTDYDFSFEAKVVSGWFTRIFFRYQDERNFHSYGIGAWTNNWESRRHHGRRRVGSTPVR